MRILPIVLLTMVCLAGCTQNTTQPAGDFEGSYTVCTAEQKAAEICTMDYTPVCGDNGETYSNICTGCSSGEINSYKMGECN